MVTDDITLDFVSKYFIKPCENIWNNHEIS